MHEVLVNRLRGLSLPRKSVVSLTDRPDMTLDVYRGRKKQYNNNHSVVDFLVDSEPMCPGFESRESHDSFFLCFFFVIIITVQICEFNITVSTQFSYFITPYDAQASSAFSTLILNGMYP